MTSIDQRLAGSLILSARLRNDMTQVEFAELVGISQPTLSAYERGARQPTMPTLLRLLRRAGFELRLELAPVDHHDDALAGWERGQPHEVTTALRRSGYQLVSDR